MTHNGKKCAFDELKRPYSSRARIGRQPPTARLDTHQVIQEHLESRCGSTFHPLGSQEVHPGEVLKPASKAMSATAVMLEPRAERRKTKKPPKFGAVGWAGHPAQTYWTMTKDWSTRRAEDGG
jgi:hypothetical protein